MGPWGVSYGIISLTVPMVLAAAALSTGNLAFKMAVPLSCLGILLVFRPEPAAYWVMAAFLFSAAGDWFLSRKEGQILPFVIGILLYLLAHGGYLAYGINGWSGVGGSSAGAGGFSSARFSLILAGLLVPYLIYYLIRLRPAVDSPLLGGAAFVYLVISCVTLAAAAGRREDLLPYALFLLGIILILVSDTVISMTEFLGYHRFNSLILPTYYGAHLAITASFFL